MKNDFIEKYPHVFARKASSIEPFAMFGIECEKGWYSILNQLFACIDNHLEWKNRNKEDEEKIPFILTQVKEKYGTLRLYYDGGDDIIDGMVRMAEAMSRVTCEVCGNAGRMRGHGWFYTACDEHTREENKE